MKQQLLFWQLFVPTCLVLGLLMTVLYVEIKEDETDNALQKVNQVKYQVNLLKNEIEGELLTVERNLVRLRNEKNILAFLESNTDINKREVVASWSNMLNAHPNFQQIRYIDTNGVELIRVERDSTTNEIIETTELQNKLDRPYVKNGLSLPKDGIKVSDFDLNQEFGEIERPIRPTIRFVSKFGEPNQKQGILVINYLCVGLFSNLDSLIDTRLSLINKHGFYLHSNDTTKNWGWLLDNKQSTLSAERPRFWFKLNQTDSYTVQTDDEWLFGKLLFTPAGASTELPQLFYTYPLKRDVPFVTSLISNTYLWIVISCALVFLGMMLWVFTTLVDLAQQREKADKANFQAQRALSVKSKFLANMSHEIRTPLNGIMGFFQLLTLEPLNKKQQGFADNGLKSTQLLAQILNDILDFSKLEANKLVLHPTAFSLETMIQDIGILMSSSLNEKRLELWLDIEPAVDMLVMCDEIRLRQILVNIANNAIKFTEEGFVKIKVTIQSETEKKVTLRFEISDSGIGLNEEQINRIFNSFEQASMETNKKYGGTGLGLNITENLLGLMGSKLQVTSKPLVGSTFWFELQLDKASNFQPNHLSNAMTSSVNQKVMQNLHVVIFSNNTIGNNILKRMCENFGWKTTPASCIERLLEITNDYALRPTQSVDVILVDKPEVNEQTWRELAQLNAQIIEADKPLIYLLITLSSDLSTAFTAAQLQLIDGHFVKPLSPSVLFDEILTRIVDQETHNTAVAPPAKLDLQGYDILLVEDNFINQEVVTNMLMGLNAHVFVVENGQLAVNILRDHPHKFHVILMDMQMPVMDGITATQYIRQTLSLTDVPIIAMTANAMDADRQACFAAGMNDHLSKPFDQAMLVEKIISNASIEV